MKLKNLQGKTWYANTLSACIAVTLYVVLTHIPAIGRALKSLISFFSPVLLGCVLAYLINPLAKLYQRTVLRRIKQEKTRWPLAVALALLTVLLCLIYFAGTLVPQLVESATAFVNNLGVYAQTLRETASHWAWAERLGLLSFLDSYEDSISTLLDYLSDNLTSILNASMAAGRSMFNWSMGLILSVYLLAAKEKLRTGADRLLRAATSERNYHEILRFLSRCNQILSRYMVYSLLDSAIIGIINAVFMQLLGMQYAGLVSIVVAVMNLIPTFGPVIGAVIGGFVLLLVNPLHAVIFVGFTLVLQTFDAYVIKPKLFGKSLGVSGLLIMISVIVGGRMFGVVGILLSIPFAAILDFVYTDYLFPALLRRKKRWEERKG